MSERKSVDAALVLLSLLACVLYGGTIFGWAPIAELLQNEGFYGSLCNNATQLACTRQTESLTLVYTLGSTTQIVGSLLAGFMVDRLGALLTTSLAGLLLCSGHLITAFISVETPGMLVPAFALVGLGGVLIFYAAMNTSWLLPEHQTLVLTSANCMFDASGSIPLILFLAHRAGSTRAALFGMSGAAAMVLCYGIVALYFLRSWSGKEMMDAGDDTSISFRSALGSKQFWLLEVWLTK